MYQQKYIKYKQKYLNLKNKQIGGNFRLDGFSYELIKPDDVIGELRVMAHKAAYDLVKFPTNFDNNNPIQDIKIVTAESLTGGLIFSSLVNIPTNGWMKYGCFGVYDTDAKRKFLGVSVKDVYTHSCVKQMAVGALLNSRANVAIAVSGNAMPEQRNQDDMRKLGEVFIGIAMYTQDNILVETKVFNFCNNPISPNIKVPSELCKLWHSNRKGEMAIRRNTNDLPEQSRRLQDGFNDFAFTNFISQYVRYSTVYQAITMCTNFLQIYGFQLVDQNKNIRNRLDNIPIINVDEQKDMLAPKGDKYNNQYQVQCINEECDDSNRSYKNEIYYDGI